VLTPHIRDPYRDDERPPAEMDILRAGTYNLGFIALKRGPDADRVLDWWAEKTEHDCVVDMDSGIMVDQKWIDLVPGYVPGTAILPNAELNVAYWNLHERVLTEEDGRYFVDGQPLRFFHFSGYNPDFPLTLSKHQTRHDLRSLPVLRRLCNQYGEQLRLEGHDGLRKVAYGYARLSNGVTLTAGMRAIVRRLRKAGTPFPRVADADAFCRFLMTPNALASGTEIAPLAAWVLSLRPDVARAFPAARYDATDPGFLAWLSSSGHECEADDIAHRFGSHLTHVNPYTRIRRLYDRREDLRTVFPDAFRTLDGLEAFGRWLNEYAIGEEGLAPEEIRIFIEAGRTGLERVLDYYFSHPGVQERYPLALLPCGDDFVEWLVGDGAKLTGLSTTDCLWFKARVAVLDVNELLLLTALRTGWANLRFPIGWTPFGWAEFVTWARAQASARGHDIKGLSPRPPKRLPAIASLEALRATGTYSSSYGHAMRSPATLRAFADSAVGLHGGPLTVEERHRIHHAASSFAPARGVNVAGYFDYAAGVGTAARALTEALDAAGIAHEDVELPVAPSRMRRAERNGGLLPERFWKLHRPDFDVAITVANADVAQAARTYLGPTFPSHRKHFAYWVWETETLPGKYADAAEGFDAILTPSEFSARGLRKTLGDSVPVEVVPYAIGLHAPNDPRPHPVVLPEDRTLFGFFFDTRSIVERKNPAALLRAFRSAFRDDDKVSLVLKVNHAESAPRQMAELEKLAEGLPVIWLRDVRLDEFELRGLLDRLDVYASLHRAEGFGLLLAEAMALGKPVVATGFSGNVEFMDAESAMLVDYQEVTTNRSVGPYPRGTRWAEPDIEQAAVMLRALHESPALRTKIGERARQRISRTLAPWLVGAKLRHLIGWTDAEQEAVPDVEPVALRVDTTSERVSSSGRVSGVVRTGVPRAMPGE
jgi:glycosyltransferase involved in cell wall biosynthesis